MASFFPAVALLAAAAAGAFGTGGLRAGAAFLVPDFATMVVLALIVLASLLGSSLLAKAVPGRLVCRLGALEFGLP